MANFLAVVVFAAVCVVFQSTLLAYLAVAGLRIELLLVIVTYLALKRPLFSGAWTVAALGYLYGLNSASPFGLQIMTFLSCFLILNMTRDRLFIQGPTFCIGLVIFIVILQEILQYLFLATRGINLRLSFSEIAIWIPKALLTGAFWPILSLALENLDHWFAPPFEPKVRRSTLEYKF